MIAARPKTIQKATVGEKTGPPWGIWKRARISDTILVEAGGIEPPSEDLQELAPTRLVPVLELAPRPPEDRLPQSQLIYDSDPHPTSER